MNAFSKFAIIAVFAASLGACGTNRSSREKELSQQLSAAIDNCKNTKFNTKLEFARCLGHAEENFSVPGSPVSDLIRVKIATRNSIAERLDAGKITQTDADLETAKVESELVGEARRRMTASRIARAQEAAADASAARNKPITCYGGPQFASCF